MSASPLTLRQAQEAVAAVERYGGNISAAARAAGLPRPTMQSRYDRGKQILAERALHGTKLDLGEEDGLTQHEQRRYEERIRDLERELLSTKKQLNIAEDIRHSVLQLKDAPPDKVFWPKTPKVKSSTVLLPLLFTSDFQCGEVIKPEEIDGLNAYNMDIFAERYQRLVERTIDLSNHHVGKADFPGIIYCRGGDAVSGLIHAELMKTNDLQACPAVKWLVRHEREGIKRLRDRFGKVRVYSIPGNHGRLWEKKESKGYVLNNFETIIAWWLETLFEGDSNVSFITPPSGDAYFKALGWNVLMSHGDRMGSSGGQGFIGPAATIMRGHKKLYDNFTRTGQPVDYILTGHLHTSLKLSLGFANGALCGYGEYARDLRADPDAPKQWLLYFHEKRGITAQYEVVVGDRPRRLAEVMHEGAKA